MHSLALQLVQIALELSDFALSINAPFFVKGKHALLGDTPCLCDAVERIDRSAARWRVEVAEAKAAALLIHMGELICYVLL